MGVKWAFIHWENDSIDGLYSANDPLAAERRKIKEDLERYMNSHGMTVEVTHKTGSKSSREELVQDLLIIVTVFLARMYGKRSQEFRQKAKQLMNDMEGGNGRGFDHQNDQDRDP